MASISSAQSALLGTNFLDNLGTDGAAFPQTLTELQVIAGELARTAQNNLAAVHHVATGSGSASIAVLAPRREGGKTVIDLEMNFYLAFVNAGVKGTQSGSSTAGYAFKRPKPSKKMVDAIRKWISDANIATRNTGKFTYGSHETRRSNVGASGPAYPIALSIVKHGLKPSGFLDKAIKTTSDNIAKRLGDKLEIDIINYLKQ